MNQIGVLLFKDFETLDVFGPVEIFGVLKDFYRISFYSESGGIINNSHGVAIETLPLDRIEESPDIFLIPGGYGTRTEVNNQGFIEKIKKIALGCKYILTVCTGSALLAKTGLLDNRKATSNKRAFDWVCSTGPYVNWIKNARWVVDGNYYTSSGVSAGMDMAFGFLRDMHGEVFSRKLAFQLEYNLQEDKDNDLFSEQ
jgi:transcriptional regulator GlxA family with amidase domain